MRFVPYFSTQGFTEIRFVQFLFNYFLYSILFEAEFRHPQSTFDNM